MEVRTLLPSELTKIYLTFNLDLWPSTVLQNPYHKAFTLKWKRESAFHLNWQKNIRPWPQHYIHVNMYYVALFLRQCTPNMNLISHWKDMSLIKVSILIPNYWQKTQVSTKSLTDTHTHTHIQRLTIMMAIVHLFNETKKREVSVSGWIGLSHFKLIQLS